MTRKNENEGGAEGFATLDNTPGMGEVVMPTATTTGSGDIFGGVMNFSGWKKRSKKRKRSKRR